MARNSTVWIIAVVGLCASITGCTGIISNAGPTVPGHTNAWLSYKYGFNCGTYFNNPLDLNGPSARLSANCPGLSAFDEANNYYNDIGAPATFPGWLSTYGFPPTGANAEAFYGNFYDLRFGRDMNCSQTGGQIACYVTNYGPPPSDCTAPGAANCSWPDLETGVNDAIGRASSGPHAPFATVAMVWNGTLNTPTTFPANNITFYVYKADGTLLNFAALDDEGAKSVPRMCMACHGGNYTPHTSTTPATVTATSFLPFDVHSFYYSKANQSLGLDQQQEAFRILNLLVKTTNGGDQAAPSQTPQQTAIIDFINGQYCPDLVNGGPLSPCPTPVEQPNSKSQAGYFPVGWKTQQKAYSEVMKPYCRMCHMAQIPTFLSSSDLSGPIQNFVCTLKDMPHAEVPFGGGTDPTLNPFIQQNDLTTHFWLDGTAVQDLQSAAGINSCQ